MGEPAIQLRAVRETTGEIRGVAEQALEWVRVSESRVAEAEKSLAEAEARASTVRAELKERAMATLGKLSEEGKERFDAERQKRRQAEARASRAEAARDRAEKAFEGAQRSATADREALVEQVAAAKGESEQAMALAVKRTEAAASKRAGEVLAEARAEADRRVAAAEQRAADAEAAAAEAQRVAVTIEAEIEERVMQGTVEVRREAEERVRHLVEKVEGEAEEHARTRAEEQLQAESDRIRAQAEQREARVRRAAEDEIKASAKRARREILAVADESAPTWSRSEPTGSGAGYRTF
jgi:golgin subfamily B member 1